MNKLVNKLLLSILSLTLSAIMLGTVTFAWITMSNTGVADGLVLNVTNGEDLQISLDGISYYNKLPGELIAKQLTNLQMHDVTSINGITFSSGGPTGLGEAIPNRDYVAITMWFRTTAAERFVYLVDNISNDVEFDTGRDGTFVVSLGRSWKADLTFVNGTDTINDVVHEGTRNTYYASKAVRIAFVEQVHDDNIYDTRIPSSLRKVIIDPSGDPLRGYGVSYGALDYISKRMSRIIEAPAQKPETVYELTKFSPNNPYIPVSDNSRIMELIVSDQKDSKGQTYYVGKVTMNIWLEGWDADCFDAIVNDVIRIQLKFRAGKSITD
ncbi:MAG TPA: hypothetical protein PLR16_01115 [Bacilli bacterium]|nr:MAG: hypothetical protein BWY97_00384 [Tenericutes bacterium ADurb.BinA124]HPX83868.1 hypothetical protein [Bacilli bacterium]